jgi:hypothetical protein
MRTIGLALLLALSFATCADEASLDARLTQEVERLQAVLDAIDPAALPKELADAPKTYGEALTRVRNTKSAEYKLFRLRDTFTGIEAIAFFAKHHKAGESAEGVAALSNERRADFDRKVKLPADSVLVRALGEGAANRAEVLFVAGPSYAKITAPWGGLYYLAEAEGNLRLRNFIASLPAYGAAEPKPKRERLVELANQLEAEALKLFEHEPGGNQVVGASVKLKEARELLDDNRLDGAALALVETRLALSRRKAEVDPGSVTEGPTAAALKPATGSVAKLLAGMAEEGAAPLPVLVPRDVVPFHASLLQSVTAKKTAAPASVTVTLVRWPYT